MKNYYEILQVNETASKEIISKVYKFLAKKYHPDANPDNQAECAEKFKEISEAYEVLSDPDKRERYDHELKMEKESQNSETVSLEKYVILQNYCNELEKKLNINNYTSSSTYSYENTNNSNSYDNEKNNYEYQKAQANAEKAAYQDAVNKAYHDAYVNNLKNMGYKVRYKKTFKETMKHYFALAITFAIMFIVFKILLAIPSTHDWIAGLFKF